MNSPSTISAREIRKRDAAQLAETVDRLLDEHLAGPAELLAPSSGFVASVMESVHAQASEPPPIAFPLHRVVPGAIATICGLIAFVVFALRAGIADADLWQFPNATLQSHRMLALSLTPGEVTLCWILVVACLSVTVIAASFRFTGSE